MAVELYRQYVKLMLMSEAELSELRKNEERADRIVNTGIRDKNRAELDALRKAPEMAVCSTQAVPWLREIGIG